ncbi:MAG: efflux RND transporter periplasmic adaptor subunit [Bacteroidetes bacterium]|nr:efflux RND transporter periplasmic adaptor subunit [Bacteroidota bacterium]
MRKNILLFFVASAVWISCSSDKKATKQDDQSGKTKLELSESQMAHIKIDSIRQQMMAEQLTAVGEVSFAEDNVVRIYPVVSGTVEKTFASLGDYVQKGQRLATLLSMDMSQIQRDYNVAKSNFSVEEKNLARAQELFSAGMMSEKEFANARKDYNNALSELNERTQILKLYGGSSSDLDAIYNVLAPRSGYIVERNVTEGTQIRNDNNTNIFTISDLKVVWVWANIPESDLSKVAEGDEVQVKTIAYPDKIFRGNVKKIGTMLDPSSRVIKIRTELNNSEGLLKPEMFASIVVTSRQRSSIKAVPQSAVILENNHYYVMRDLGDRKFEKVVITIGKTFGNYYEVSSGLKIGDRVVSEGSLFVLTAYNRL